jgi:hypothetical protein
VTLPLSILAATAAVLLFKGGIPADGFGGVERLAVFPLRCWMVIAGIFLLRDAAGVTDLVRLAVRRPFA